MIFGQCEGSGCHWHGTWESYDLPVFLGVVPWQVHFIESIAMDGNIVFWGKTGPRIAVLRHQMVASTVTKPKSISAGNMTNSGLF